MERRRFDKYIYIHHCVAAIAEISNLLAAARTLEEEAWQNEEKSIPLCQHGCEAEILFLCVLQVLTTSPRVHSMMQYPY